MNLHFALAGTPCRVVEIILPAICTWWDLGWCTNRLATISAIAIEIGYGVTAGPAVQERLSLDHKLFESFSGRFRLKTHACAALTCVGKPFIEGGTRSCREGRRLFVAREDQLNRGVAERFDDVEVFFPRHPKDLRHAFTVLGRGE
jgi:hypothetical protein